MTSLQTIWVFGDQLNTSIGALSTASPATNRILIIQSEYKVTSRPWHQQRLHFLLSSMRHFALQLEEAGFEVDYRTAPTMTQGFRDHVAQFNPSLVIATEPNSVSARTMVKNLGVTTVPTNQFLTSHGEFAAWASTRKSLKMEDFYRRQRVRLNYLMDGTEPAGGQWNFDHDNREAPPKSGVYPWAAPPTSPLDHIDDEVIAALPSTSVGSHPTGTWATTRHGALARLQHFVTHLLPVFGPHEDAMLSDNWHLAHSMLSPYLNNGLLLPSEVCDAVQREFDAGRVPIASAEGFIRQIIGWREYVNGLYWLWMPDYAHMNELEAHRPLPPVFRDPSSTRMACMAGCVGDVHERAWAHHIPRLMVMGNLALIAGINPQEMTNWMWEMFIDAAEWVMVPNVIGMSLHADGGRMATKPYAGGGAYIDRMSNYCKTCTYDRKKRVGDDACPFSTLYWDFLLRNADRFVRNPRIATQVRAAQKLTDGEAVQRRAAEVLAMLDSGRL
jgi:deoxyribodipyrimidine photolyase-related protein